MSAVIQRPRRLTSEGVGEDSREAVDTVGSSVNTFMEEAYIAIMGNLGPNSNLNMEFKTLKVEVDGSGAPKNTIKYSSSINGKVIGMFVVRAFDAIPTNQPFITFSENSGLVTLSHVSGLAADTEYRLVILAIGS